MRKQKHEYVDVRISIKAAGTVRLYGQTPYQWLVDTAESRVESKRPWFSEEEVVSTDISIDGTYFRVRFTL